MFFGVDEMAVVRRARGGDDQKLLFPVSTNGGSPLFTAELRNCSAPEIRNDRRHFWEERRDSDTNEVARRLRFAPLPSPPKRGGSENQVLVASRYRCMMKRVKLRWSRDTESQGSGEGTFYGGAVAKDLPNLTFVWVSSMEGIRRPMVDHSIYMSLPVQSSIKYISVVPLPILYTELIVWVSTTESAMTDPFSMAGTAVGIISLGLTVGEKLMNFTKGFAHASNEIRQLQSIIKDFQPILQQLHRLAYSVDLGTSKDVIEDLLEKSLKNFVRINDHLTRFDDINQPGSRKRITARIGFTLDGSEIKALVQQLEGIKKDLQLAIQISNVFVDSDSSMSPFCPPPDHITDFYSNISHGIYAIVKAQASKVAQIQDSMRSYHTTTLRSLDASVAASQTHTAEISKNISTEVVPPLVEIKERVEQYSKALINLPADIARSAEYTVGKYTSTLRELKQEMIEAIKSSSPTQETLTCSRRVGNGCIKRRRMKIWRKGGRFGTLIVTETLTETSPAAGAHFLSSITLGKERSFLYFAPAISSLGFALRFNSAAWGISVTLDIPVRRTFSYRTNPAFDLAARGDLSGVHRLLELEEIRISDVEEDGTFRSCCRGPLLHVQTLSAVIYDKLTDIKIAAREGHIELCNYLISHGADPYLTYMGPILFVGVWYMNSPVSAIELANPLSLPTAFGTWDVPFLDNAFLAGFIDRLFRQNPAAAPSQYTRAIREFIDMTRGPTSSKYDNALSILWFALQQDPYIISNIRQYREVLEIVFTQTTHPIHCLVFNLPCVTWWTGSQEPPDMVIFDILLDHNIQPAENVKRVWQPQSAMYPLCYSSRRFFERLYRISPCVSVDDLGNTPLHYIFGLGTSNVFSQGLDDGLAEFRFRLRVMMSSGVDINHTNKKGKTALHHDCTEHYTHYDCGATDTAFINAMMSEGADPTIRDVHGRSPIYNCARDVATPHIFQYLYSCKDEHIPNLAKDIRDGLRDCKLDKLDKIWFRRSRHAIHPLEEIVEYLVEVSKAPKKL
ncbi:hypothetical protein K440DRAFT_641426 [Wilcoxina mikolae CBS 423.85]|nr:hypothetical protein K440DRAFT_641426 [Wilcoxina mikolae CBS 423.85]